MLKRPAKAQKATRKRRKGGTTYPVMKFDLPPDEKAVEENVRVWDVSTSGRTGHVSASRRTVRHWHEALNEPEDLEVAGEVNAEEAGTLADPVASANTEGGREKKSAKANKENDSVSATVY